MANKSRTIRGIDDITWKKFTKIVAKKNDGKLRGTFSFVADELNDLLRLYVSKKGVLHTHTEMKRDLQEKVKEVALTQGIPAVENLLDDNMVVGSRGRDDYINFAERCISRDILGDSYQIKKKMMDDEDKMFR